MHSRSPRVAFNDPGAGLCASPSAATHSLIPDFNALASAPVFHHELILKLSNGFAGLAGSAVISGVLPSLVSFESSAPVLLSLSPTVANSGSILSSGLTVQPLSARHCSVITGLSPCAAQAFRASCKSDALAPRL